MKILDATFIVQGGERGMFVVEFAFAPQFVRVWNKGDYGDASAKPLLERENSQRRFKPCATHVVELVALAFDAEPPTQFGKNRAAAEAREEIAAKPSKRRPKFKLIGGPT